MTKQIFLDMDGVVADFNHGAHVLHDRVKPGEPTPQPEEWDFFTAWGLDTKKFFDPMGFEFWAGLRPLWDGMMLAHHLIRRGYKVAVVTSPALTHGCVDGKNDWLSRNLPELAEYTVYTKHKELLAGNGVLVDDSERNVQKFVEAGGQAVLVPRTWNHMRGYLNSGYFDVVGLATAVENAVESGSTRPARASK